MVGENIKRLRLARGWSQQDLADRMGYKNRSTIGKIETGVNDVSQQTIIKFANAFNVSIKDILGEDFLQRDYVATNGDIEYILECVRKMSDRDIESLKKYAQFLVGDPNA